MSKFNQNTVKVGDFVSFKSDVEQSAEVIEIKTYSGYRGKPLVFVVKAPADGFSGNYIGWAKTQEIFADDCY